MPSARVVPTLDPSEDRQACLGLDIPAAPGNQLTFQVGKETLGHGVVVGIVHGSHGRLYAHFLAPVAKGNAGVLAALVGVWWSNLNRPNDRFF